MEINDPKIVITRTPGKILVCGGYLVISPNYRGLIFNSETYFQCEGKFMKLENNTSNENIKSNDLIISVFSNDFNKTFKYKLSFKYNPENNEAEINLSQTEGSDNRFVEFSIINAIYFFLMKNFNHIQNIHNKYTELTKYNFLQINLKADYRFYTYDKAMSNKDKVKTGLGSSSGLICSLNTNLYILLSKTFLDNSDIFDQFTNLRQLNRNDQACILLSSYFSNNQAQKKVRKKIFINY